MAVPSDSLKATLAQEYPVSLKEIDPIIDRIHNRYPFLDRYEITIIVRSFFETIRYLLITGETISLKGLVSNMKLLTFSRFIDGKKLLSNKIKLTTPKEMKHGR